MLPHYDLSESLRAAWRTNDRVMTEFVRRLPPAVWELRPSGPRQRAVREIAAHIHNARCAWIKTLGREHGVPTPSRVDFRHATRAQVVTGLKRSGAGMEALIELGFASNDEIPPSKGYVWRNLSLDVGHVVTYFVAHEAHHRGQIVMLARQAGHRLDAATTNALWWWKMEKPKPSRTASPQRAVMSGRMTV